MHTAKFREQTRSGVSRTPRFPDAWGIGAELPYLAPQEGSPSDPALASNLEDSRNPIHPGASHPRLHHSTKHSFEHAPGSLKGGKGLICKLCNLGLVGGVKNWHDPLVASPCRALHSPFTILIILPSDLPIVRPGIRDKILYPATFTIIPPATAEGLDLCLRRRLGPALLRLPSLPGADTPTTSRIYGIMFSGLPATGPARAVLAPIGRSPSRPGSIPTPVGGFLLPRAVTTRIGGMVLARRLLLLPLGLLGLSSLSMLARLGLLGLVALALLGLPYGLTSYCSKTVLVSVHVVVHNFMSHVNMFEHSGNKCLRDCKPSQTTPKARCLFTPWGNQYRTRQIRSSKSCETQDSFVPRGEAKALSSRVRLRISTLANGLSTGRLQPKRSEKTAKAATSINGQRPDKCT